MKIESIDVECLAVMVVVERGPVVWQCRPHLHVEFENTGFG
jgi:hypothetical protein